MRALHLLLVHLLTCTLFATPEAFEVGPEQKEALPGGKEADGIVGDFVLRNDVVEAVISANLPSRRANMSTFYGDTGTTPGCLYDLTLRGAKNDQITVFAPAQQQGPISWVRVAKSGSEGEAVIECVVTAANNEGISRRHEYRLRDGWQGVQVTTILKNETKTPRKVAVGDKWTNFWRTGTAPGGIIWADAVDPADRAGYAIGYTDDPAGASKLGTRDINPGEAITFTRFLAVGHSPAEAVGLVMEKLGPVGRVTGEIKDSRGAPASTAQIVVRAVAAQVPETGAEAAPAAKPTVMQRIAARTSRAAGLAYPDAAGRVGFALAPGKYRLTATDAGRADIEQEIEVRAGEETKWSPPFAVASAVQFDISDEAGVSIPCKAQFHAMEGTEPVNLGPDQRAHGCREQYHSERGSFRVPVRPGRYRVIVTRGIECSHLEREITLKVGETINFAGKLTRLVDTKGWVSADYHNHSTPSGDNTCGTDDRLINLAAEHIEFAPTTEHNRLYDWRPNLERLGLLKFVQTVPGLELTGNRAHFNAFPFKPVPQTQDNGAPVWNKDPRITAITLRDWGGSEPDRWIQINHPDMVTNFIDADEDGRADGGYGGLATLIDGIETQNGRGSELLDGRPFRIGRDAKTGRETVFWIREFIWLQMLNRGHQYAAMAVCDAHTVWGNGVGGWRMYFPSASDEPAQIDWRENVRAAKAGRSYLTNGPFLQVVADDGTHPGGTARAAFGAVKLHVHVQCTDWIDIDRVQVLVNGRALPDFNYTRAKNPGMFKSGVVKFDETISVRLSEDSHLIVVACSEQGDLHVGYGTSPQSKMRPFAYHNPIFVDLDGHGFRPNGDSLEWQLPVKKLSVEEAKRQLIERGFDTGLPPIETEL